MLNAIIILDGGSLVNLRTVRVRPYELAGNRRMRCRRLRLLQGRLPATELAAHQIRGDARGVRWKGPR